MLKISSNNSSTTPLGASESFVGTSEDISGFGVVKITVRADPGASGVLVVSFSPNDAIWTDTSYPISDPSTQATIIVPADDQYFKIRYDNGGTALSGFRVQSLFDSGSGSVVAGGGGGGGGSGTLVRQVFTLSASDITNKSITISSAPTNPATLDFIPYGGLKQRYQVDYDISSNVISWSGLGLDGVLAANDVIEVSYFT